MSETKEEKQRDREMGRKTWVRQSGADTKRQREWGRQLQTDQRQTIRGR